MDRQALAEIAQQIVANGKGVLAADESFPTIGKRFDTINVENTEANRQAYRQLMFTADAADYIGGVILFDETIRQSTDDGKPFPQLLAEQGIVPGIKVDKGAKPLAGFEGETITEGLDGLRDRLAEYYDLGARFAKWRAVIDINVDEAVPSAYAIQSNAAALARYAALCQEAGIVPIVEPEVLMDGDHSIEDCYDVTTAALDALFSELKDAEVEMEGILLKPNMIVPGKKCPEQADVQRVAELTVRCLKSCVPATVPGIVFLSGGQSEQLATEHLDAMNKLGELPWALSFSYGRALQQSALNTWRGEAGNIADAQAAYAHRAKCNALAAKGEYSVEMEANA